MGDFEIYHIPDTLQCTDSNEKKEKSFCTLVVSLEHKTTSPPEGYN